MKSDENWSNGFRQKTFKDFTILYMYITERQGQITPGDKTWFVTEKFYHLSYIVSFRLKFFNTV